MRLLYGLTAAIALCALPVAAGGEPINREALGYPVKILAVVDGDTVALDGSAWSPFPNLAWKVRVRGIDTPEKRSKCAAEKSAALRSATFTKRLMVMAKSRAYLQAVAHDKYGGRFDAVIVLPNGKSLGDILIASGLARPYLGGKRLPWCDSLGRLIP